MTKLKVENWLSATELDKIEYSDYWNNKENERGKAWNIVDDNFSKMEAHILETGLSQDLKQCIDMLNNDFHGKLKGSGIDLACGNLWAAAHLFNLGEIDRLYCLEYSKHRLLELGPKVLEHYNVSNERVVLVVGSFYDLHVKNNSLDFVFLSQAFHHADKPHDLLTEIKRVLKPNGVVIIIGEHIVNPLEGYLKHAIRFFISMCIPLKMQKILFSTTFHTTRLIPNTGDLFPIDPILGDHYYTQKEYLLMFKEHGFSVKHLKNPKSNFRSFVLISLKA